MNKTIKIMSTLLIAIFLVATLSQVCLASDYKDIINVVDKEGKGQADGLDDLKIKAGKAVQAIRNISKEINR